MEILLNNNNKPLNLNQLYKILNKLLFMKKKSIDMIIMNYLTREDDSEYEQSKETKGKD